jgi:hypothetical protein
MKRLGRFAFGVTAISLVCVAPVIAQQPASTAAPHLPFSSTLSNSTPLAFGMNVEDVSRALGEPLSRVSGRRADEIYLAIRNIGGSGLFNHHDRLFLQFRNGKLTGWKGDWGHNWMWQ